MTAHPDPLNEGGLPICLLGVSGFSIWNAEHQTSKLKVAGSNPAGVATMKISSRDFRCLGPFLSNRVGRLDNFGTLFVPRLLLRAQHVHCLTHESRLISGTCVADDF
jgi:hypothetical protein